MANKLGKRIRRKHSYPKSRGSLHMLSQMNRYMLPYNISNSLARTAMRLRAHRLWCSSRRRCLRLRFLYASAQRFETFFSRRKHIETPRCDRIFRLFKWRERERPSESGQYTLSDHWFLSSILGTNFSSSAGSAQLEWRLRVGLTFREPNMWSLLGSRISSYHILMLDSNLYPNLFIGIWNKLCRSTLFVVAFIDEVTNDR